MTEPKPGLLHTPVATTQTGPFYVVSTTKFWVLYVATLGGYQFVWFLLHWHQQRQSQSERLSPFWRSAFSIFFVHNLFARIRESARAAETPHKQPSAALATAFVVLSVISRVTARVIDEKTAFGLSDAVGLAIIWSVGTILVVAQHSANAAAGDPRGASNSQLTAVNWLFIALGGIVWFMMLIGTLNPDLLPESK